MKLLVIDVQVGISDERIYQYTTFIQNLQDLIAYARNKKIEVIYVQHDDGVGTGFSIGDEEFDIDPHIYPLPTDKRFVKVKHSAFSNDELKAYLLSDSDHQLIITGLQTNFCIDATIKSALDENFTVYVPTNCNSTFDNAYMDKQTTYRYYNEWIWKKNGAICLSLDELKNLLQ